MAVAAIKRRATSMSTGWDDEVHDPALRSMLVEVVARVTNDDPVRGSWCVDGSEFTVWVDASSLALGVALAVDGRIIEDACWLRPENDAKHINLAELDATLKGVNLALQWQARILHIITDSTCVHRWMTNALNGKARLTTKASAEMLIRRRLATLTETTKEYDLVIDVTLVQSCLNQADRLTRVPRRWLDLPKEVNESAPVNCAAVGHRLSPEHINDVHCQSGHPGVNRTLYFARLVDPSVSRRAVKSVVGSCNTCRSIDPAPVRWKKGILSVKRNWDRIAMDITHYNGRHFLTLIDCGPSRFSLWRPLRRQDAAAIIHELEGVFLERGPPSEILTDNGPAFVSEPFKQFADGWGVHLRFRCAHVPSGNGIIERNHRTVKTIAARKGCTVPEAVYWYNVTPKDDVSPSTAPANALHTYRVRVRGLESSSLPEPEPPQKNIKEGDVVWVKNPRGQCTTRYGTGHVTEVISPQAVRVDGVPRHIKDLRSVFQTQLPLDEDSEIESVTSDPSFWFMTASTHSDTESGSLQSTDPPADDEDPDSDTAMLSFRFADLRVTEDSADDDEAPNPPLRRSTRRKRPPPPCSFCDNEIRGECVINCEQTGLPDKRSRCALCKAGTSKEKWQDGGGRLILPSNHAKSRVLSHTREFSLA